MDIIFVSINLSRPSKLDKVINHDALFPNNMQPVFASPLDFCVSLTALLVLRNRKRLLAV